VRRRHGLDIVRRRRRLKRLREKFSPFRPSIMPSITGSFRRPLPTAENLIRTIDAKATGRFTAQFSPISAMHGGTEGAELGGENWVHAGVPTVGR